MPKGIFAVFISAGLILAGCGGAPTPSANTVQTAIAQTAVAAPTNTTPPSATPIPPTATMRPTDTPTPRPIETPTNTPVPPTPTPSSTPDLRPTYSVTEAKYVAVLQGVAVDYLDLRQSSSDLMDAVISGNAANANFGAVFTNIDLATNDLAAMKSIAPPPRYTQAHAAFLKLAAGDITLAQQIMALSTNVSDGQIKAVSATLDKNKQDVDAWTKAFEATKVGMNPNMPTVGLPEVTPAPAIATQVAFAVNATATAVERAAVGYTLADYKTIPAKELISYADRHGGEKVKISGRVFNIIKGDDAVQMYLAGTYDAVVVSFRDALSNIYEDSYITIYGVIADDGFTCFKNAMGGDVCQPHIFNAFIVK